MCTFAPLPNGDLVAGGDFSTAGGLVSAYVARLTTTCPASAVAQASGCTSGGPTLVASRLPWVGGTFHSTCSGMATVSLGLAALGATSPGWPLSLIHPAGAPGCLLLASPDLTLYLLPVNGVATLQFNIPVNATLVGVMLRHQVLELEFDANLNLISLKSSNGLTLTIGMF